MLLNKNYSMQSHFALIGLVLATLLISVLVRDSSAAMPWLTLFLALTALLVGLAQQTLP